jgi:hypothetical protein
MRLFHRRGNWGIVGIVGIIPQKRLETPRKIFTRTELADNLGSVGIHSTCYRETI